MRMKQNWIWSASPRWQSRLSAIDTNDLATKTNAARKFLEKGNKVKVTLRFRGREMSHMSQSRYILDDFAKSLADIAVIDKPSKVEGRTLVMFMSAKKN